MQSSRTNTKERTGKDAKNAGECLRSVQVRVTFLSIFNIEICKETVTLKALKPMSICTYVDLNEHKTPEFIERCMSVCAHICNTDIRHVLSW